MGVHFTTVAKLERDERRLTYEWAVKFAEAFGVSIPEVSEHLAGVDLGSSYMPAIKQSQGFQWHSNVQKTKTLIRMSAAEPRAFAMEVEERDMVDRGTSNLIAPVGSHVIVDPDQRDLCEGQYFAISDDSKSTRFIRFLTDPARLELCTRDEADEDLMVGRSPFSVIGRLIGVYAKLS
jgi:repressor LexA